MSHRSPVRVADRHAFHTLIDARSPAEYALDHIPGAINCPVLDDDERRIVGTIYKQQGAFEARRVGGAMVAANLARHLRTQFADQPASWKPLIYCWRGGMRSGSMVTWLRLVGWDAQQLAGGYKSWRRHVIDRLAELAPQLPLRVICGPTGSAKTRVLQALAARGAQVLDLEACARHRGSVLGAWPGVAQPSQTAFETALLQEIAVPVACPTMVCFGGPELRTLFVTTARHGRPAGELARTPLAGQVLVLDAPVQVPGLPVHAFRETRWLAGVDV